MPASQNPWSEIPTDPPYVLPMDRPYTDMANAVLSNPSSRLHPERLPEPRSGPRNAPIVVLQLNPSFDQETGDSPLSDYDQQRLRAGLHDEYAPHIGIADQHRWWRIAFAEPIAHFGGDHQRVARSVCSVEYFPYPSLNFACAHLRLPSQAYQFQLVREAVARNALIVVTRGWSLWLGAVPELYGTLGNVLQTRNPRRVTFSRRNLPQGGYERVIAAIESVPATE